MPRNPTLFTITIPVTKKMIDEAAEVSTVDLDIEYSDDHFRAAGLDLRKIRQELAHDEKFRAKVIRQLIVSSKEGIDAAFNDQRIGMPYHPTIKEAVKRLDAAVRAEDQRLENERQDERVKEATALLHARGYRVVKA